MSPGATLLLLFPPSGPAPTPAGALQALNPWGWGFFFAGGSAVVAAPPIGSDHDVVEDVIARLIATGQFDADAVVGYEAKGPAAADWSAMARVVPGEATNGDDFYPFTLIRRGSYTLTIEIRDSDIPERDRLLARAVAAAVNALNGVQLAEITAPAMTLLRSDGRPVIAGPSAVATLKGQWAFASPGYGGLFIDN